MNEEVNMWREEAKRILKEDGKYSAGVKHLLDMAAEAGDGEASHLLAMMECDGNLNEYPVEDAKFKNGIAWLKQSADSGNTMSQYQYGRILIFADAAPDMTGLDYLIKSSEGGCAMASYELADLYSSELDWGDVFKPDFRTATEWYEKAIAQGCLEAADKLGELLYPLACEEFNRQKSAKDSVDAEIEDVLSDGCALVRKVYDLTLKAAEAGFPCSQMRLAAMCADKMGASCDDEKADADARMWLACAERSGSELASECIDMILKQNKTVKEAIDFYRSRIS